MSVWFRLVRVRRSKMKEEKRSLIIIPRLRLIGEGRVPEKELENMAKG